MSETEIDLAEVNETTRLLIAEHGIKAVMYAQEKIMEANAADDLQDATFWQAVSRALQTPSHVGPVF